MLGRPLERVAPHMSGVFIFVSERVGPGHLSEMVKLEQIGKEKRGIKSMEKKHNYNKRKFRPLNL